jgi:DNA mismatch endonuclease (patch repair protein)
MPDVHSPQTRSYNMSRIRSRDTGPEMLLRRWLFSRGFRYRLHDKKLPGKPDIVLPKYRTVIFVHGCFWHGHEGCRYFVMPKTRTEWWREKIQKNAERDKEAVTSLKLIGWKPIELWECELKNSVRIENLKKLELRIKEINAKKTDFY